MWDLVYVQLKDVQSFISVFKFAALFSALIYYTHVIFTSIVYPQSRQTPKNNILEKSSTTRSSLDGVLRVSMKSSVRRRSLPSSQSSMTYSAGSVNLGRGGMRIGLDGDNRSIADSEAGEILGRCRG